MSKLYFKASMLFSVLVGKAIVIKVNNDKQLLVDTNRQNKIEVQRVATLFFREAYNL